MTKMPQNPPIAALGKVVMKIAKMKTQSERRRR
jgi:hypothetical protein